MAHPATEENIAAAKEILRSYLKEKGHRITPERFMVLEAIYRADGHLDADDMYLQMKNTGSRVSRATVYNTLDVLVECGLVQKQQFGNNQSFYERAYSYQQHDHLVCTECGKVLEFCDPRVLEIQKMVEKYFDFRIKSHSLHFQGICNGCTEKIGRN
jgi:Fur family ferric uptake transcriptional regulator